MAVIDSLGPAARGRRLDTFGRLNESAPDDDLQRAAWSGTATSSSAACSTATRCSAGREDLLAQPRAHADLPDAQRGDEGASSTARASWPSSTRCSGPPRAATTSSGCAISHPSHGIPPHCDTVFMGRGTPDVLTAWIPFGDIPIRAGGLMVLEHSHHSSRNSASPTTCEQDVDTLLRERPQRRAGHDRRDEVGALARPDRLERRDHRGPARSSRETGTRAG